MNVVTVEQINSNETKYTMPQNLAPLTDNTIKTKYDEFYINPRLLKTENTYGQSYQYNYDKLGRLSSRNLYPGTNPEMCVYTYLNGTLVLENITYALFKSPWVLIDFGYNYLNGKVSNFSNAIRDSSQSLDITYNTIYGYDSGERLTSEENEALGFTFSYEYLDNRLSKVYKTKNGIKRLYKDFVYDAERITSLKEHDYDTQTILKQRTYEYDNIGNPIAITKNGSRKTLGWTRGKFLQSYKGLTYVYNSQGIRTEKVYSDGTIKKLYYDGNKLLGFDYGTDRIRFFYDATGIAGIVQGNWVNGFTFTSYAKDALGNIQKLFRGNEIIAQYFYDAWGNCTVVDTDGNPISDSNHIANINPIRWKGYYYDVETGFYLIHNSYYDPEIGQFVNAESPEMLMNRAIEIGGLNGYTLPMPNPLMMPANWYNCFPSLPLVAECGVESVGGFLGWWNDLHWGWKIGLGAVIIIGLGVLTPFTGGLSSIVGAAFTGSLTSATVGFVAGGINSLLSGERFIDGAADGFMWGAITGAIGGGAGSALGNIGKKLGKVGYALIQAGINSAVSGLITAGQSLITDNFSWGSVGLSMFFGGIGGALGTHPVWGEGARNISVGFGLGTAESAVGITIEQVANSAASAINETVLYLINRTK